MVRMRSLLCLLLMLGQPSLAQVNTAEGQLRMFANCAGRLTAQLEHQWLLQSENADQIERQRTEIVMILQSMVTRDRGRDVLSWRTEARAAQRALLNRASFAADKSDASWAADKAESYLLECTGFLLS